MRKFLRKIKKFLSDDKGVTAVEYALIVGIMAVAIVAAWPTLSDALGSQFGPIAADLAGPP